MIPLFQFREILHWIKKKTFEGVLYIGRKTLFFGLISWHAELPASGIKPTPSAGEVQRDNVGSDGGACSDVGSPGTQERGTETGELLQEQGFH